MAGEKGRCRRALRGGLLHRILRGERLPRPRRPVRADHLCVYQGQGRVVRAGPLRVHGREVPRKALLAGDVDLVLRARRRRPRGGRAAVLQGDLVLRVFHDHHQHDARAAVRQPGQDDRRGPALVVAGLYRVAADLLRQLGVPRSRRDHRAQLQQQPLAVLLRVRGGHGEENGARAAVRRPRLRRDRAAAVRGIPRCLCADVLPGDSRFPERVAAGPVRDILLLPVRGRGRGRERDQRRRGPTGKNEERKTRKVQKTVQTLRGGDRRG
mmetsp:Transcript_4857/g.11981  ORF Transcript_4857/g.11981 Transcript_4857/m.11981 type:complete len:268 (-) Transcript_4857:4190-4993(-)